MTVRSSRTASLLDFETVLRDPDDGSETVSTVGQGIRLPPRHRAYWDADPSDTQGALDAVRVAVQIKEIRVDGNQQYTLVFYADSTSMPPGSVELLRMPVNAVGSFTVEIDRTAMDRAVPNSADTFLLVGIQMSGANTSINFGAWIA